MEATERKNQTLLREKKQLSKERRGSKHGVPLNCVFFTQTHTMYHLSCVLLIAGKY